MAKTIKLKGYLSVNDSRKGEELILKASYIRKVLHIKKQNTYFLNEA